MRQLSHPLSLLLEDYKQCDSETEFSEGPSRDPGESLEMKRFLWRRCFSYFLTEAFIIVPLWLLGFT